MEPGPNDWGKGGFESPISHPAQRQPEPPAADRFIELEGHRLLPGCFPNGMVLRL